MRPVVFLNGGLGNQLFGAAFAYSLSVERGQPVQLSTHYLTRRPLELDNFQLPENLEISDINPPMRGLLLKLRPRLIFETLSKTYSEKEFHFMSVEKNIIRTRFYFGYFQSPKYFYKHGEALKTIFKLRSESPALSKLISEIAGETIGIHLRRGDYLGKENYHGLASEEYFRNAINLLKRDSKPSKIVVFSEDRVSAEKIFPDAWKIITPQDLESPAETLVLMSKVSKFIGSNSSFSWWSAFLATGQGRPTIFPRPWFSTSKNNDRDLLMPEWITLGNGLND